jgi:hypothetical protein
MTSGFLIMGFLQIVLFINIRFSSPTKKNSMKKTVGNVVARPICVCLKHSTHPKIEMGAGPGPTHWEASETGACQISGVILKSEMVEISKKHKHNKSKVQCKH